MILETQAIDHFSVKIPISLKVGRYLIKTISSKEELRQAFSLRYQVFQVEKVGADQLFGEDQDEFDAASDHLAIFDLNSEQMIATCRLNCSLFSRHFYSEQEFHCRELIQIPEIKLEIGRVCVHREHRKSIVIMLLWRAIAEYMKKTDTKYLFGCGSVMTEDPEQAYVLCRYLREEGKLRATFDIHPTEKYRSLEFERLYFNERDSLTPQERVTAQELLPSLCKSYFDIGCFTPGPPAFDKEFKCIDFLTILNVDELSPQFRQKMFGV